MSEVPSLRYFAFRASGDRSGRFFYNRVRRALSTMPFYSYLFEDPLGADLQDYAYANATGNWPAVPAYLPNEPFGGEGMLRMFRNLVRHTGIFAENRPYVMNMVPEVYFQSFKPLLNALRRFVVRWREERARRRRVQRYLVDIGINQLGESPQRGLLKYTFDQPLMLTWNRSSV